MKRVAGPAALRGLQRFDPDDPLHVDQAARVLLRRFFETADGKAFELLVELCEKHLMRAAEAVAQEVGLAMPADELVVAFFARLFADLRPARDPAHLLKDATDWMAEQADAWVRDLALSEVPAPGSRAAGGDGDEAAGGPVKSPGSRDDDAFAGIVKICFHRLDVQSRRLLRARDVLGLEIEEIARQNGLGPEETRQALRQARRRLNEAVARAFKGADP